MFHGGEKAKTHITDKENESLAAFYKCPQCRQSLNLVYEKCKNHVAMGM